eukprot:44027-Prymnesium_polylepis.1
MWQVGCGLFYLLDEEIAHPERLRPAGLHAMLARSERRRFFVSVNIYHVLQKNYVIKGINMVSRDVLHLPVGCGLRTLIAARESLSLHFHLPVGCGLRTLIAASPSPYTSTCPSGAGCQGLILILPPHLPVGCGLPPPNPNPGPSPHNDRTAARLFLPLARAFPTR